MSRLLPEELVLHVRRDHRWKLHSSLIQKEKNKI